MHELQQQNKLKKADYGAFSFNWGEAKVEPTAA
jgi:hypothetical protein